MTSTVGTLRVSLPYGHPLTIEPVKPGDGFTVDMTRDGIVQRWRTIISAVQRDADGGFTLELQLLDSTPVGYGPSDEDRIRDAMTEATEHPGRIVTR